MTPLTKKTKPSYRVAKTHEKLGFHPKLLAVKVLTMKAINYIQIE